MTKKLEKQFEEGEKVVFIPTSEIYDFGYMSEMVGKAIIYEEGARNIQDSCVVELNQLRKI